MKTRLIIRLVAETEIMMDVDIDGDGDPTTLSEKDKIRAARIARECTPNPDWDVDHVEES